MPITDVTIRKTFNEGLLRAIVSIVIDDVLAVHDIKLLQTDKLFVAMPSRIDELNVRRSFAHPINSETRHYIESQIIEAYNKYIEENNIKSDDSTNSKIKRPAAKKQVPQRTNYLRVKENQLKIAHAIPSGYTIWNIGTNMPSGFLPICKLKQQQPFDGAREIIEESLIAVPLPEAQLILSLVSQGINTIGKMQSYVKRFEKRAKSEAVKTRIAQCKTAIELLMKIPGATDLTE